MTTTPATIEGTVTPITKPRTKRASVPAPEVSPASPALDTLTGALPALPTMLTTQMLDVHPANPPHRSERGFEELAEQIRARGEITQDLIVRQIPEQSGPGAATTWEVLSGARRLAAARYLGMLVVPVRVLRDCTDAEALAWVLAENTNRVDFSLSEQAHLVQAQLDLGISEEAIATAAGKKREWVARRRAIAKLAAPSRRVLDVAPDTDLVQAAAIAEFADDADLVASLTEVAQFEPTQLAHEISRARQDREEQEVVAAEVAIHEAAGTTVLDVRPSWDDKSVLTLDHVSAKAGGRALTAEEHADCPGRAVLVGYRRTYGTNEQVVASTVHFCTTWKTAGHYNRHAQNSSGSTSGPMDEKQKAERAHLVKTNKAAEAATPVRRAWLEEFFQRDKMPADALVYAAQISAITYGAPSQASALELVGFKTTGYSLDGATAWLANPTHAHKHLVALAAAQVEDAMPKDYWRQTGTLCFGRHLLQLQTWGYSLAPHEQDVVGAWAKLTAKADK